MPRIVRILRMSVSLVIYAVGALPLLLGGALWIAAGLVWPSSRNGGPLYDEAERAKAIKSARRGW